MGKPPSRNLSARFNAKFDELDAHRRFNLHDLSTCELNALGGLEKATIVADGMRDSILRLIRRLATLHRQAAMEIAVAKGQLPAGMYIDRCEPTREGVTLFWGTTAGRRHECMVSWHELEQGKPDDPEEVPL